MRTVLDTNVLIAALIARGVCTDLLQHCVLNHTIVVSDFILNELQEKLVQKFKYTDEEADDALTLVRSQMEIIDPQPLTNPVCRDADDDWILATAVTGSAKCIITGDKDLLSIQQYKGIDIIPPTDFANYETV